MYIWHKKYVYNAAALFLRIAYHPPASLRDDCVNREKAACLKKRHPESAFKIRVLKREACPET